MLNPYLVDYFIAKYTASALRDMLQCWEVSAIERAHIIAAIYYLGGTDNA